MAKDYLPIPSTSVSSEREFSGAKDIIGLRRTSLLMKTITMEKCVQRATSFFEDLETKV